KHQNKCNPVHTYLSHSAGFGAFNTSDVGVNSRSRRNDSGTHLIIVIHHRRPSFATAAGWRIKRTCFRRLSLRR
ncbi:unnamed protein product, partial [Mycena citricolor]